MKVLMRAERLKKEKALQEKEKATKRRKKKHETQTEKPPLP